MRISTPLSSSVALVALALQPITSYAAPSAQAYYVQAVEHMKQLPQPAFATYTAQLHAYGARMLVTRDTSDGGLGLALMIGSKDGAIDQSLPIALRGADNETSTQLPDATHAVSHFAFVNATWGGAYDTMRYGWEGPPATPAPAVATPAPEATSVPVIAVISVMSPGFYRVEDAGAQTCANGAPGHRVHLIARSDAHEHPLTDAVIDTRTLQFCSLTFGIRARGILGATGSMVLNFADEGPYQLISDGRVDFNLRAFGFAVKRLGAQVKFTNFTFPQTLPDAVFAREKGAAPSPKPSPTPGA